MPTTTITGFQESKSVWLWSRYVMKSHVHEKMHVFEFANSVIFYCWFFMQSKLFISSIFPDLSFRPTFNSYN